MYHRYAFIFLTSTLLLFGYSSHIFAYEIGQVISHMTNEEKVGQLLMVHFNGMSVNEDAKRLIQKVHAGAFIYYNWANGLEDPIQVQKLSADLQKLAQAQPLSIPLFIAVDQEGGRVNRLKNGFTLFPSNLLIGQTKQPKIAGEVAFAIGEQLKTVGINLNLAPVVDINSNPNNPVIGDRSFGESPQEVAEYGKWALDGYKRANIVSCLKHFPGHGDTRVDSHAELPVINKSTEELWKIELFPFVQLAKEADMIMTAHILLPSLDSTKCATLSSILLKDLLREQIGFDGVIISDSLVMQSVLNNASSVEEAAIQAVNAGCDMIILGGKQLLDNQNSLELSIEDVVKIHRSLVEAVRVGRIPEKRLNESVERILKLKERIQNSETRQRGGIINETHTFQFSLLCVFSVPLCLFGLKCM